MEIVKRLEGSAPEEIKYDFEEHYLKEDREDSKRKKSTFFSMIAIIIIAILGYLGFKNFNSNDTKTSNLQNVVTTVLPVKSESNNTLTIQKVEQKEDKEITPIVKKEPQRIEKIATYTEVLAQELKPQAIKKIVPPVREIVPLVIKATPPSPKIDKVLKVVKVVPVKKVIKKPIPKKKIVKRIVVKKPRAKMALERSRTTIVKKGDTLALLSKRFYGSTKEYNRIIRANKSIKNHKSNLKIGQKILIPSLKAPKKQKVIPKKTRVVIIKKGDTLNIIAQRYYGNSTEFKRIIRANKNIRSAKTSLKLGQKIIVPYLPKNKRRRFVTAKKGYSLAYISKKFYGNIKEIEKIVKANPNIKNQNSTLHIGQKVYVPR